MNSRINLVQKPVKFKTYSLGEDNVEIATILTNRLIKIT